MKVGLFRFVVAAARVGGMSPMQSLFNRIAGSFKWMDAIESAIPATLAIVLILAGRALTPAGLLHLGNYSESAVIGLWLLVTLALIRSLRRGRSAWVGGSLICLWLIWTIVAWWKMAS